MTLSIPNIPYGFCHCGCGQETLRATKCTSSGPSGNKTRYKKDEPYKFRRGHANRISVPIEDAKPFKIEGVYCRLIPLSREMWTIVDEADYGWLMQWKWSVAQYKCGNRYYFYAIRCKFINGKTKAVFMHAMLGGKDHRNRITLDNRRTNLRPATQRQNAQNRGLPANNTSGYKGVHQDKRRNRWVAEIEGQWIASFTSIVDAARAYDREAVRRFGEFAWLNFPNERSVHEQAIALESD